MSQSVAPQPDDAASSGTLFPTPASSGPAHLSRIPSLDGLRAISISIVVAFHIVNAASWRATGHDYTGPWQYLINGGLGVSVFFVISGFLITQLLLLEIARTGTVSLVGFYIRRTFRIWPAFYVYLLVVAVLGFFHVIRFNPYRDFLSSALFVFNYVPNAGSPWLAHTWSLAVEEQFYFLWPALLLLGVRRCRWFAILLIIFSPIVRFSEVRFLPRTSVFTRQLWEMGHTRMDTIMFGCLLALLAEGEKFKALMALAFRWRLHWIALAGVIFCWPVLRHLLPPNLQVSIGYSIEGLCIGVVLLWCITYPTTGFARVLNWKPLVHLGAISYSLYLWNPLFCNAPNKAWTGLFPWNLLCSIALAELSRYAVELPFLRIRSKSILSEAKPSRRILPVHE